MAVKYTNAFSLLSGSSSSVPTSKPVNLERANDRQTRSVRNEGEMMGARTATAQRSRNVQRTTP